MEKKNVHSKMLNERKKIIDEIDQINKWIKSSWKRLVVLLPVFFVLSLIMPFLSRSKAQGVYLLDKIKYEYLVLDYFMILIGMYLIKYFLKCKKLKRRKKKYLLNKLEYLKNDN